MIIQLSEIIDSEKEFSFVSQPDLEEETARLTEPVRATGKVLKRLVQIDIEGELSGEIEIDCTRCLLPGKFKLVSPFKVGYVSRENYSNDAEAQVNIEDLEIAVYENDRIDLGDLVREQIILNLPTQFYCKEDCRGLCWKCGANKNLTNCNCEEKEIDPRWSALSKLRD